MEYQGCPQQEAQNQVLCYRHQYRLIPNGFHRYKLCESAFTFQGLSYSSSRIWLCIRQAINGDCISMRSVDCAMRGLDPNRKGYVDLARIEFVQARHPLIRFKQGGIAPRRLKSLPVLLSARVGSSLTFAYPRSQLSLSRDSSA